MEEQALKKGQQQGESTPLQPHFKEGTVLAQAPEYWGGRGGRAMLASEAEGRTDRSTGNGHPAVLKERRGE